MKLLELIKDLDFECVQGSTDIDITTLVYDSRKVEDGSVFVCISGAVRDGHDFAKDVVKAGAKALIVEKNVDVPDDVTVIKVADTRLGLAVSSAAYFGNPANELTTIGITVTRGKPLQLIWFVPYWRNQASKQDLSELSRVLSVMRSFHLQIPHLSHM